MIKICEQGGNEFEVKTPHLTKGLKPKKYCSKECSCKKQKEYYQKRKILVLEHYGGKCACCGETKIEFLTLNHTDNDGRKHREEVGAGSQIYGWLVRNNFPLEPKLQVLCWNCQEAKTHYGYCPHKK
jgi:hypothetical protein